MDSHETFLTMFQTKWKFLYNDSLCVSDFSAQIFIVFVPVAAILEGFPFPLCSFYKNAMVLSVLFTNIEN